MGRKKKEIATRGNSAVVEFDWNKEMATYANEALAQEKGGTGLWLSTKGAEFGFGDDSFGEVINAVIIDFAFDNAMYEDSYDPDNPQIPYCFSLGRDEEELAPHEQCEEPQNKMCESCEFNQWGSGDDEKGKACKNKRRLALIRADDEDDITPQSDVVFLSIPSASIKYWKKYVAKIGKVMNMHPMGVITQLEITKERKGFSIRPTLVEPVQSTEARQAIISLRKNLGDDLLTPYQKLEADEPVKKGKKKASKKKASKKKISKKKASRSSKIKTMERDEDTTTKRRAKRKY